MKPLWTGAVAFGLVTIPVKVFPGTERRRPRFHYIHETDGAPIRYARICTAEGREIPFREVGRAVKEGNRLEPVPEAALARHRPPRSPLIEVLGFCWVEEIDGVYFQKPYYLEPDRGGERSYAVFREALHRTQRAGLVQYVTRGRFHLGLVRPLGDLLVLVQMRLQNQLRRPEGLSLPEAGLARRKEVETAVALITHLSRPFRPERYRDTYTEHLIHSLEGPAPQVLPRADERQDLLSLLKASLKKPKDEEAA